MNSLTHFGNLFALFDMLEGFHVQPNPYRGLDAWWEDNSLVISLEMPGFEKGKISVVAEDGLLTVSATREDERKEGSKDYLVKSSFGRSEFARKLELPDGLDVDSADCTYDSGVLEVTIPKAECKDKLKLEVK